MMILFLNLNRLQPGELVDKILFTLSYLRYAIYHRLLITTNLQLLELRERPIENIYLIFSQSKNHFFYFLHKTTKGGR